MLSLPDFIEKKILIVFPQKGDKISFKNDNIVISDENNKIKTQYTCYKLFIVFIVGGFNITTGIIERAKRFNFAIVLMTNSFKIYEMINIEMAGNTLLRSKQYNNNKELIISKKIIYNKIFNQMQILNCIRNKNEKQKESIRFLKDYISKVELVKESYELMGIEGVASKTYFKNLYINMNWKRREPRVKRDYINYLLDLGYTLLFTYIEAIVSIYGFDIYKGVLHREFFKRKSLICDLIEPFRCIIDYKIKKMFSLSQINEEDFIIDNGKYSLNWEKNLKYMNLFIEEITENKELIFKYIQAYYRWFMKDKKIDQFPIVDIMKGDIKNDTN